MVALTALLGSASRRLRGGGACAGSPCSRTRPLITPRGGPEPKVKQARDAIVHDCAHGADRRSAPAPPRGRRLRRVALLPDTSAHPRGAGTEGQASERRYCARLRSRRGSALGAGASAGGAERRVALLPHTPAHNASWRQDRRSSKREALSCELTAAPSARGRLALRGGGAPACKITCRWKGLQRIGFVLHPARSLSCMSKY
jgi:hypothetical protein